jgi:hypothetical protein
MSILKYFVVHIDSFINIGLGALLMGYAFNRSVYMYNKDI